jgi:hypothetical protein
MLIKIAVLLLAIGYIGYKVSVALEITRARRRGDAARAEQLAAQGFGFYRFTLGTLIAVGFFVVVVMIVIAVH